MVLENEHLKKIRKKRLIELGMADKKRSLNKIQSFTTKKIAEKTN